MIAAVSSNRAFVAVRLLPSMNRLSGLTRTSPLAFPRAVFTTGTPRYDAEDQCLLLRGRERCVGRESLGDDAGEWVLFLQHVDAGRNAPL